MILISSLEALERYRADDHQEYGHHTEPLHSQERNITVPLTRGRILSTEDLAAQFSLEDDEATRLQMTLERSLLYAILISALPPGARLTDPGGRDAFEEVFVPEGFSPLAIASAYERFNDRFSGPVSLSGALPETDQIPQSPRLSNAVPDARNDVAADSRIAGMDGEETGIPLIQALDLPDTDGESEHSWQGGDEIDESRREGQSLLNLLYHIAEDQARRDGYVHRGVSCNSCNTQPIRGIRYRCSNCMDFDLCEQCEALQIHPKTHVFYKVRIPAPFTGNPRNIQPVWYPGRSIGLPQRFSRETSNRFQKTSGLEGAEIEALWDQFKCLAATEWPEDPDELGIAIDRLTFDKCFTASTSTRRPPPNLIYDRMFSFYDTNSDGLIGFGEFLAGLSNLKSKNKAEKMKKIFQGYDLDRDGYVSRKDMLRMFRAFYALTKEITREMIAGMEEDMIGEGTQRDVVEGSQPISSAFPGSIPPGEPSRIGEGKSMGPNGDYITDHVGILDENDDDRGDHHEAVADRNERATFGDISGSDSGNIERLNDEDPAELEDLLQDFGETSNVEAVVLPGDRDRVIGDHHLAQDIDNPAGSIAVHAAELGMSKYLAGKRELVRRKSVQERWGRRQFYLDEEDGIVAPELTDSHSISASNNTAESISPIEARMNAIKYIRNSSSLKSFKASVRDEIHSRNWYAEDDTETIVLVDFLINMAGLRYETEKIGTDLQHLIKCNDALEFTNWFLDHIMTTEKEAKRKSSITSNGHAVRPLRRSRSSSKVRFQDDLTDGELESQSNASVSSRSIPVGERWGGYEIPEPEKDLGREYLYQVTQEALNELLDPIFRQREGLSVEVARTKVERTKLRPFITRWSTKGKKKLVEIQMKRFQNQWRSTMFPRTWAWTRAGHESTSVGEEIRMIIAHEQKSESTEYAKNLEDLWQIGVPGLVKENREDLVRAVELFMTADSNTAVETNTSGPLEESAGADTPVTTDPFEADNTDGTDNIPANFLEVPALTPPGDQRSLGTWDAFAMNPDPFQNGYERTEFPEAAEELHSTVTTFNEADLAFEQNIQRKPLEELLQHAGYFIAEEPNQTSSQVDPTLPQHRLTSISQNDLMSTPVDQATTATTGNRVKGTVLDPGHVDPTLPQNRPSKYPTGETTAADLLSSLPRPTSVYESISPSSPKLSHSKLNITEAEYRDQSFQDKLKFLAMMDFIEREDEERGGPGKISFEEFEEIMHGPRGGKLAFVGAWIQMATFWGSGI